MGVWTGLARAGGLLSCSACGGGRIAARGFVGGVVQSDRWYGGSCGSGVWGGRRHCLRFGVVAGWLVSGYSEERGKARTGPVVWK